MRKTLTELFKDIPCSWSGEDIEVTGIEIDSRKVEQGALFFAYKGERSDGRAFIGEAIRKGASAVCTDDSILQSEECPTVPLVVTNDVHKALAKVSDVFWGFPSRKMKLIGITGTNGKTTTAFYLKHILQHSRIPAGLIGTIRSETGEAVVHTGLTTPEAHEFNHLLFRMIQAGTEYAIAEVSSQGIDKGRVDELQFAQCVFTNLSGEHLDYHGSMEEYFEAKARIFEVLHTDNTAIVNIDDDYGARLSSMYSNAAGVSMGKDCFVKGSVLRVSVEGTTVKIEALGNRATVTLNRPGLHNCMNFLLAAASALTIGVPFNEVMRAASCLPVVPGRLEEVDSGQDFKVYVDYAHTDNALKNVLEALRSIIKGNIITVFGAGGDRDRTKRPRMGKVACELSDQVIITSDNPRTEDPLAIIKNIRAGTSSREWKIIPDRKEAIQAAIDAAKTGDAVIIAGKGHEDYQIIGEERIHFSDVEVAHKALLKRLNR